MLKLIMNRRLFIYINIALIILIFSVSYRIVLYIRAANLIANPLDSKLLVFTKVDGLKYFYEPKAKTKWNIDSNVLKELGYPPNSKVQIELNENGFNQLYNYPVEKEDGVYRIITVGDSFTFGSNVNTKDNYPSQLQNLLNQKCLGKVKKFQVLNLGVAGYDFQYTVERYKLRGRKYNPDLVLWFMLDDDFVRIDEAQIPSVAILTSKAVTAKDKKNDLRYSNNIYRWIWVENKVTEGLGGENKVLGMQEKYLNEFNKYYSGRLVYFTKYNTLQKHEEILSKSSKSRPNTFFYSDLIDIYGDKKNYLNDKHPTAEGYKVIVDDLFQYLVGNKIIPCGSN